MALRFYILKKRVLHGAGTRIMFIAFKLFIQTVCAYDLGPVFDTDYRLPVQQTHFEEIVLRINLIQE